MNFKKLRAALLLHCENYICSACENPYDKAKKIKSASESELLKMAEAAHLDLSKFKD